MSSRKIDDEARGRNEKSAFPKKGALFVVKPLGSAHFGSFASKKALSLIKFFSSREKLGEL